MQSMPRLLLLYLMCFWDLDTFVCGQVIVVPQRYLQLWAYIIRA